MKSRDNVVPKDTKGDKMPDDSVFNVDVLNKEGGFFRKGLKH